MTGLKIIDDPAALSFFLTEALYAVKESAPAQPVQQGQPAPAPIQPGQRGKPEPTPADHPASSKVKEEPEVYHYLGENRRFVLVLVNYPDEKHLPEVEKAYRSEEHTSELQSRENLVCRLLLEKKKKK